MTERLDTKFRRLVDLRREYDMARAAADAAEEEYRAFERTLWGLLEDMGIKTQTFELGEGYGEYHFERRKTVTGYVYEIESFLDYLDERQLSDEYTKPDVRKRQVNNLVRRLRENKQAMPPGVETKERRYVSIQRRGERPVGGGDDE